MSLPIPTQEPRTLTAGETALWQRSLSDTPAPTWSVNYYLVGPQRINIASSANGTAHEINVNVATTSNWTPGVYSVRARVSDGASVFPISTAFPTVEIIADPATSEAPPIFDVRTWQVQTLEVVESAIKSLAGKTVSSASVNGTFYTLADIEKLYVLRARLKSEISATEFPRGKLIYTAFRNPI